MGIALLALTGLFKNFAISSMPPLLPTKRHLGRIHPTWAVRPNVCTLPAKAQKKPTNSSPTLRVLRIQDLDQTALSAGRMVISGRMADVCAELDRLVAIEALHHSSRMP